MPGLMSQGAILTASRFSNFAILVLSPLLLVRILDVDAYGQYQEFMLYAMLFVAVCGFGIDASLTYFLPRHPGKDREYVSQNTVLVLIFSSACIGILLLLRQQFLAITTYDFVLPLAAYVFLFVNLNWLEYYWIAKKRTDLVLLYSAGRLLLRVSVLITAALVSNDLRTILWALVGTEAFRVTLIAYWLFRGRFLTVAPDWERTLEQIRFAAPIGLAGLLQQASRSIGKLYIGSILGPVFLAFYAVASYLLPLVLVIRGSIADVIFPELVRIGRDPQNSIRLWQRSNIIFCVLLFPPFILLNFYAELIIVTLFTEEYRPAIPIFQVYALWLLRRCLNMDVLLRTRGRTGFMLVGTCFSIVVNAILMLLFYRFFGLVGPALAYIVAEVLLEFYYALLVKKEFNMRVSELLDWAGVARTGLACLISLPILFVADQVPGPELLRAFAASILFIVTCWYFIYRLGVKDVGKIVSFLLSLTDRSRQSN